VANADGIKIIGQLGAVDFGQYILSYRCKAYFVEEDAGFRGRTKRFISYSSDTTKNSWSYGDGTADSGYENVF